jgi:hypothetical protein
VGKEDLVALALRVDADIVLGVGRMGEERLDDKIVEGAGHRLDLDRLPCALHDPRLALVPLLVQA